MNGCIYRTQSDLCKLYTKDDTISFCKGEDCPDRKQSNADRIRSMTDEELAHNLFLLESSLIFRHEEWILAWLKAEAEEVKFDNVQIRRFSDDKRR